MDNDVDPCLDTGDLDSNDFDPASAAAALRLMADKAPDFANQEGHLDARSTLVRSAADLLQAANDWLDHHRTRPFEVRAGERVLRSLEERSSVLCNSFVLALRETATELTCLDSLGKIRPLSLSDC
jgi:hypothetical protein